MARDKNKFTERWNRLSPEERLAEMGYTSEEDFRLEQAGKHAELLVRISLEPKDGEQSRSLAELPIVRATTHYAASVLRGSEEGLRAGTLPPFDLIPCTRQQGVLWITPAK